MSEGHKLHTKPVRGLGVRTRISNQRREDAAKMHWSGGKGGKDDYRKGNGEADAGISDSGDEASSLDKADPLKIGEITKETPHL